MSATNSKDHRAALAADPVMQHLLHEARKTAEQQFKQMIDTIVDANPAVMEAVKKLAEIREQQKAINFEKALIAYQINSQLSPIAARVQAATASERAEVTQITGEIRSYSSPAIEAASFDL